MPSACGGWHATREFIPHPSLREGRGTRAFPRSSERGPIKDMPCACGAWHGTREFIPHSSLREGRGTWGRMWWVTTHPSMKARCLSTAVSSKSLCRVRVPVFYPSFGAGLAQLGAFEIVMTAPSTYEWAHRPTQGWDERVITSTGPRHDDFLNTPTRQASLAASGGTTIGPIDWPPRLPPNTSACHA